MSVCLGVCDFLMLFLYMRISLRCFGCLYVCLSRHLLFLSVPLSVLLLQSLSVCGFVCLGVCDFLMLFLYMRISLRCFGCLYVCLSRHLLFLSVPLSVLLLQSLSVCGFVCLGVCDFLMLFLYMRISLRCFGCLYVCLSRHLLFLSVPLSVLLLQSLSVCGFVCLGVCDFLMLFLYMRISLRCFGCLYVCLSRHLLFLSVPLSVLLLQSLSVCGFVCLGICLSVCGFVCLGVCLWLCLSGCLTD